MSYSLEPAWTQVVEEMEVSAPPAVTLLSTYVPPVVSKWSALRVSVSTCVSREPSAL